LEGGNIVPYTDNIQRSVESGTLKLKRVFSPQLQGQQGGGAGAGAAPPPLTPETIKEGIANVRGKEDPKVTAVKLRGLAKTDQERAMVEQEIKAAGLDAAKSLSQVQSERAGAFTQQQMVQSQANKDIPYLENLKKIYEDAIKLRRQQGEQYTADIEQKLADVNQRLAYSQSTVR